MKIGVPITAEITPVGTIFSVIADSATAKQSVKSNKAAPSTELAISCLPGERKPLALTILGAINPVKLMTPAAVTKADTIQTPNNVKIKKT